MSQDLQDISNLIRNETVDGGNTKERVASAFDIVNTDKLDSGGSTKTGKQLDEEKLDSGGYFGNAQNLYDLIFSIEGGYNGIASTDIINPLTQGYYVSLTGGTFPNFGNISIPEGYSIIYYDNSVWKYESIPLNPNNPILDTEFFI